MTAREPLWEQNGLPPIVNIMWIALVKSQSTRSASYQPADMGHCPAINHTHPLCLPLWPFMIELMVVLFDVFLDGKYDSICIESWCYSRKWVWNFRTKVC